MAYRLKKGVVLFQMCGEDFLFPSREAGAKAAFLVSSTPEISALLSGHTTSTEDQISPEAAAKLKRFVGLGFVEECI